MEFSQISDLSCWAVMPAYLESMLGQLREAALVVFDHRGKFLHRELTIAVGIRIAE